MSSSDEHEELRKKLQNLKKREDSLMYHEVFDTAAGDNRYYDPKSSEKSQEKINKEVTQILEELNKTRAEIKKIETVLKVAREKANGDGTKGGRKNGKRKSKNMTKRSKKKKCRKTRHKIR